jgi:N-acetyl-anhydromuramyl-L-alanine amidase AmpD
MPAAMNTRLVVMTMLVGGCSGVVAPRPASGPVALSVEEAAARNGIDRDLMLSIAAVEGGLLLQKVRVLRVDEDVPVAGVLELRHGKLNTLARGAELMGTDETALQIDTDLGTEAGARVLTELGRENGANASDLTSWIPAIEELSGLSDLDSKREYVTQVMAVLKTGGTFPARGGEQVVIVAHPEVDVPAPSVRYEAANGTPDFPGAIWFTTSCTNKCDIGRPDGNAAVNTIIIHDTEGGWAGSVATLQNDAGKSVHYIVDADGSRVGQFRPETDTTWHAGNYVVNKHSIGIEHVGVAADASGYSDGLYQKSAELVKSIRSRWSVPLDRTHIYGHYQVANGNTIGESAPPCTLTLDACETSPDYGGAGNHRDPGYYWQWCQYMERLGGSCTCNDTYPLWNCTTDHTEAVRCTNGNVEIDHCTAGCNSMPIGTNDVCNKTPDPGSNPDPTPGGGTGMTGSPAPNPAGGGAGGGGSASNGGGSGGGDTSAQGGGASGGCSMGGRAGATPAAIILGLIVIGLAARRRPLPL